MVYQEHLTKFCVLKAWTSNPNQTSEVAYQVLDIYLLVGAVHILQSDNGAEFTAAVINELKDLWKDFSHCTWQTTVSLEPRFSGAC